MLSIDFLFPKSAKFYWKQIWYRAGPQLMHLIWVALSCVDGFLYRSHPPDKCAVSSCHFNCLIGEPSTNLRVVFLMHNPWIIVLHRWVHSFVGPVTRLIAEFIDVPLSVDESRLIHGIGAPVGLWARNEWEDPRAKSYPWINFVSS